jgi:hypothetical protein
LRWSSLDECRSSSGDDECRHVWKVWKNESFSAGEPLFAAALNRVATVGHLVSFSDLSKSLLFGNLENNWQMNIERPGG